MELRYKVRREFTAKRVGDGVDTHRIFQPGESLWWDEDDSLVPVIFKVDGFKWQADDRVG